MILEVDNLTKKYGSFSAVDRVSFGLSAGEIVGLLGPNGAGKTTTINMILGILKPTAGTIRMLGRDLAASRSEFAKRINFAAVYAHLPYNLTVYEDLYVFGLLYEVPDLKAKIGETMKVYDLEKFARTRVGLLSSGEASRLNLAKAVINDPCLLLLDEPTASIDPSVAETVRERIREYAVKFKAAVLWTSHNMHEIEATCDRVLFLSHGRILLAGDPRVLPSAHGKKNLEELFISLAREPLGNGSI
jgi:ABC-2 type transport system ATP-binding protein